MIVSRLVLKNWRNFRSIDVPLSDRVFMIGPNAAGKSNLLDVFRFLRDVAKAGGGCKERSHAEGAFRSFAVSPRDANRTSKSKSNSQRAPNSSTGTRSA